MTNNYTQITLFRVGEYNPLNVTKELLAGWCEFLGAHSVSIDDGHIVTLLPKANLSRVDKLIEHCQHSWSVPTSETVSIPAPTMKTAQAVSSDAMVQVVLLPADTFSLDMVTEEWCKAQAERLGAVRVFLERGRLEAILPLRSVAGAAELLSGLAVKSVAFSVGARGESRDVDGKFKPERLTWSYANIQCTYKA